MCIRDRSDSDNDTDGWCTFETIVSDDGEEDHDVSFDQTVKFTNSESMRNKFLLDTGSTIRATVMNKDLITNIRASKKPTIMSTNAGSKVLKIDGDVKGFGVAKYDPTHMANIMGFSHMANKYHVTCDSRKEDAFLVHLSLIHI